MKIEKTGCTFFGLLFLCLLSSCLPSTARETADKPAGQSINIYYTGNTWGYLRPCPS